MSDDLAEMRGHRKGMSGWDAVALGASVVSGGITVLTVIWLGGEAKASLEAGQLLISQRLDSMDRDRAVARDNNDRRLSVIERQIEATGLTQSRIQDNANATATLLATMQQAQASTAAERARLVSESDRRMLAEESRLDHLEAERLPTSERMGGLEAKIDRLGDRVELGLRQIEEVKQTVQGRQQAPR